MAQFRTLACTCLLLAALLALAPLGAPLAQDGSGDGVFTVSGIPVDATADDAVSARRTAILEGQRDGLERLFQRLVPADERSRLPPLASLPVEDLVRNFSIGDEELSATRYLAVLTVSYDPEAVRELLQQAEVPYAQVPSQPLLVLPLYEGPGGPRLWPDGNPWWQAWAEELDQERLLRLTLPLGDLEDMALVDVAEVQAGNIEALSELAARYGSEDVLIATARVPPEGTTAVPTVRLEARRLGNVERTGEPLTLTGEPGQEQAELLAVAVRRLQDSLDERWKAANLLRFDQGGLMVVEIPINALADWVRISRGLAGLAEVNRVDITRFARDTVRAQIRYMGDETGLADALLRLGLTLSREGETWQLLPTEESRRPGAPASARSASSSPAPRSTLPTASPSADW